MADIQHAWIHDTGRDVFTSTTYETTHTLSAGSPANGDAMVVGGEYLIIVQHSIDHDSTTDHHYFKVVHGSTDFAESEIRREHRDGSSGVGQAIGFATIFTQPDPVEDILIQTKTDDTVTPDNGMRVTNIIAIRLDQDLTENTDWWEAVDDDIATPVALQFESPGSAFASQTLTTVANAEYVIIGFARTLINSTTRSYIWELSVAGTVTASDQVEGEDTEEVRSSFLVSKFTEGGTGQSRTFEMQGSYTPSEGAAHKHDFSRILVFKMTDVFADFAGFQNTGTVTRAVTDTEIASLNPTLSTSQDVLLLTGATDDAGLSARLSRSQIQEGGVDVVDANAFHSVGYDVTDETWFGLAFMHASQSGTLDYDNDAIANAVGGNWINRNFIMWGMELAAAAAAVYPPFPRGQGTARRNTLVRM